MVVIVPAAGLSTRFPGLKPKYLLEDTQHTIMLARAIKNYVGKHRVVVGILQQHDNEYGSKDILKKVFGNSIDVVVLDNVTKGPADTVVQIIDAINITQGSMLVKDCDSFFDHKDIPGNYVCVADAKEHDVLYNLSAKSFVIPNNQSIINEIVEKNIVSDYFCVGGYKFDSVREFKHYFGRVSNTNEMFVSHVIQHMIYDGILFTTNLVRDYEDVGTLEAWQNYNEKL